MKTKPTDAMFPGQYQHAEAFCLVWYTCQKCGHAERMWNSRDGVTPFALQCPSCGKPNLIHSHMHLDQKAPDHVPYPGQRVWVNMTRQMAEDFALSLYRRHGKPLDEAKIAQFALDLYGEGKTPHLVVTGYKMDVKPLTPDEAKPGA